MNSTIILTESTMMMNGSSMSTAMFKLTSFKTFIWTYVIPLLILASIVSNLISLRVFLHRQTMKHSIYSYLQVHSILNIFYLIFCSIYFLIKMRWIKMDRFVDTNYLLTVYELYIYTILNSIIGVLLLLIELCVSVKRLFIILNLTKVLNIHLSFLSVNLMCLAASVLIHLPMLAISRVVIDVNPQLGYHISYDPIRSNQICKFMWPMASVLKGIVAPLVFLGISIAILVVYFRQMGKKMSMLNMRVLKEDQENSAKRVKSKLINRYHFL